MKTKPDQQQSAFRKGWIWMKDIRAMIVDDSGFSIALIKGMLERKGITVIAEAETVAEGIRKSRELVPDFITMDMTLPDGNGLECSEAILRDNPGIKIIAISSMMDEELVRQAKKAGIKAFIQKPIDEQELFAKMDRIFSGEGLYGILRKSYKEVFKESLLTNVLRSIDETAFFEEVNNDDYKTIRKVDGFSVTVGIIGRHLGRIMIDLSEDMAVAVARNMYAKEEVTSKEMIVFFSEFANVISGNAVSMLNSLNRGLGLRVSPPTVFYGKELVLSTGEIPSESYLLKTKYGDIFMNVGFKRGDDEWM